jgi:tetratricopeptide (TPR) repeat protein
MISPHRFPARKHSPIPLRLFPVLIFLFSFPSSIAAQSARVQHFPNPDKELLEQGQKAMDRQDYAAAAEAYRRFVADQPEEAYGHFQLGYAYTALNRHDEATAEYRKAVELDPKMSEAQMNLGLELLEKDPASAVEPLRKAAELMPDQARPKFLLGWALELSGQAAPAIEQYQHAEKLDAKNFDIHFALGRALLASHRPADAETEFRLALELKPDSRQSGLGLAESLIAQKRFEPAADQLDAYLKAQPQDSETRIQRARVLADLSKFDEALAELDQAEKIKPATLATLKLRAQLYTELKKYPEATVALRKAISEAPKDAELHDRLAHALMELRQYPPAAQEFGIAYQLDPRITPALRNWISAQFLAQNYAAALAGLDLLEKHEPPADGTTFVRAVCYDKLGKLPEALDAYQKFLAMHPGTNDDQYFEAAARARSLTKALKLKGKK